MTDNMFDNLRTLRAATTPGEWSARTYHGLMAAVDVEDGLIGSSMSTADAVFIVAAHNELPALLARLDEVTAERDSLAAVVEKAMRIAARDNDVVLYRILSAAPSSVLAAHDAKVRAEALRDVVDALPKKWVEAISFEEWLRARADKEESR